MYKTYYNDNCSLPFGTMTRAIYKTIFYSVEK